MKVEKTKGKVSLKNWWLVSAECDDGIKKRMEEMFDDVQKRLSNNFQKQLIKSTEEALEILLTNEEFPVIINFPYISDSYGNSKSPLDVIFGLQFDDFTKPFLYRTNLEEAMISELECGFDDNKKERIALSLRELADKIEKTEDPFNKEPKG